MTNAPLLGSVSRKTFSQKFPAKTRTVISFLIARKCSFFRKKISTVKSFVRESVVLPLAQTPFLIPQIILGSSDTKTNVNNVIGFALSLPILKTSLFLKSRSPGKYEISPSSSPKLAVVTPLDTLSISFVIAR